MLSFKCPLCDEALVQQAQSYQCCNKHNFDRAREGYINLHLVQEKKSKQPGDSAEMLRARQQFLAAGYYDFLVDAILRLLKELSPAKAQQDLSDEHATLLDIGCGEGYYLEKLSRQLNHVDFYGIDIAKQGVRMAAKRKQPLQLAVASAYKLPWFDASFDALVSVFSPLSPEECARVLKPGGRLLMVGPGEHHLAELAEQIYTQQHAHAGNFQSMDDCSLFEPIQTEHCHRHAHIAGADLPNLLKMTPYYWHASPQKQASLENMASLDTQLQFELRLYRKS